MATYQKVQFFLYSFSDCSLCVPFVVEIGRKLFSDWIDSRFFFFFPTTFFFFPFFPFLFLFLFPYCRKRPLCAWMLVFRCRTSPLREARPSLTRQRAHSVFLCSKRQLSFLLLLLLSMTAETHGIPSFSRVRSWMERRLSSCHSFSLAAMVSIPFATFFPFILQASSTFPSLPLLLSDTFNELAEDDQGTYSHVFVQKGIANADLELIRFIENEMKHGNAETDCKKPCPLPSS